MLEEADQKNGQREIEYDLGYHGGHYTMTAEFALNLIGFTGDYEEKDSILGCMPNKIGAGCNYLGGGIRGTVHGSGKAEDFEQHGVPARYAAELGKLAKACIQRYIELEGALNDQEDEEGETNWDAKATAAARRSGAISAY